MKSVTDFAQSRRVRCALIIFVAPLAWVCGVLWRDVATLYVWKPAERLIADVRGAAENFHPCVQPRESYFDSGTNLEDEIAAIVRGSTDRHVQIGVRVENWGTRKIQVRSSYAVMTNSQCGVLVVLYGFLCIATVCLRCMLVSAEEDLKNARLRIDGLARELDDARNDAEARGDVETTD